MTDLDLLRRHLLRLGKVLLGYSGGVDSALLAVVASEALGAERFLAACCHDGARQRAAIDYDCVCRGYPLTPRGLTYAL